jgi:hypothetical protein
VTDAAPTDPAALAAHAGPGESRVAPAAGFYALRRGDRLAPFLVTVGPEQVSAYLAATGESTAGWARDVPPLALGAYTLAGMMEQLALPPGAVHAGQEFEFLRAVVPGAALEARVSIAQRSERRGVLLLAFDLELRDTAAAGAELVARGRATVFGPARPEAAP